jgi:hypothetical protein
MICGAGDRTSGPVYDRQCCTTESQPQPLEEKLTLKGKYVIFWVEMVILKVLFCENKETDISLV